MMNGKILLFILSFVWHSNSQAEALLSGTPTICDHEWMRLKDLPPMGIAEYEKMLQRNPKFGFFGSPFEGEEDYYYYLARIPFVIGKEDVPSIEQRQNWLQLASEKGHKAAKAALLRINYLGVIDPQSPSYSWPKYISSKAKSINRMDYLSAAREAAEHGDPEFAAVMLDTALNINAQLHCAPEDRAESGSSSNWHRKCKTQEITYLSETKKWAMIAARAGHPGAKATICAATSGGNSRQALAMGFTKDADEAYPWCFSTMLSACTSRDFEHSVAEMLEKGHGTKASEEKYRSLIKAIESRRLEKMIVFPQVTK